MGLDGSQWVQIGSEIQNSKLKLQYELYALYLSYLSVNESESGMKLSYGSSRLGQNLVKLGQT